MLNKMKMLSNKVVQIECSPSYSNFYLEFNTNHIDTCNGIPNLML